MRSKHCFTNFFNRVLPSGHRKRSSLIEHQSEFSEFFSNTKIMPSQLVLSLVKNDRESQGHYNSYMKEFTVAYELMQQGDVTNAKKKMELAQEYLYKVNVGTTAMMYDYTRSDVLMDTIESLRDDFEIKNADSKY